MRWASGDKRKGSTMTQRQIYRHCVYCHCVALPPLLADSDQVGGEVEWIAAWGIAQPGWWLEFWDTGGHLDPPVGVVEESVVAPA